MKFDRRSALVGGLACAAASLPLAGCKGGGRINPDATWLGLLGMIHGNHRTSESYSLAILESAIRKAAPDVILIEIPPDRVEQALASFDNTGTVDEPRTNVFPEYTEVIIPLSRELGFEVRGTSGWTPEIAAHRSETLARISEDPARAGQWAEHLAAQRRYARELAGRGDDPRFIHTREFDILVEQSRLPYQRNFDPDLGVAGWVQINGAHTDLIVAELDSISGEGKTALITFGSAHKYMIIRALLYREDIEPMDVRRLFPSEA